MIPKHGVTLEVWSAIYGTSVSFLKRASAAGVDISNRAEFMVYVRDHGRETTKFAVAERTSQGMDPKERARTRTRANPDVMKFANRGQSTLPTPAEPPKPPKPPTRPPVKSGPALLDLLPKIHYSGPAITLLVSMSPEQIKSAIAAGVTMNDAEALKKWLNP